MIPPPLLHNYLQEKNCFAASALPVIFLHANIITTIIDYRVIMYNRQTGWEKRQARLGSVDFG